MEIELQVLENRGNLDSGGSGELVAMGGFGPVNEQEILVTILLLMLTGIIFSLSNTGKAIFNAIDNLGAATSVSVAGGGGGAEFTFENK